MSVGTTCLPMASSVVRTFSLAGSAYAAGTPSGSLVLYLILLGAMGTCAPTSIPRLMPEPYVWNSPSCGVRIISFTSASLEMVARCAGIMYSGSAGTSTVSVNVPFIVA